MWFRDLAGSKPLANLAKKAPSFNKKEEIFSYLCDHNVSMKKAMWFLKLSAAHTTTVTEQKSKKRQIPDPSIEWTATVIRVMKDLSSKLAEHCALEKQPKLIKTSPSGPIFMTSSRCTRCSIDRRLMSSRSPRDKGQLMGKDKQTADSKLLLKAKSLREKVLNRSLMKDARFRELKMAKRKLHMTDMIPAKKVKRSMKVTRIKAATRNRREQQDEQQKDADGNPSDELPLNAAELSGANGTTTTTDDTNAIGTGTNLDLKEKPTSKLLRKRIAMRKRNGLQSISQIIADLLAKRAKKRATQRLNDLVNEQNAAMNQIDADGQQSKSPSAAANAAAASSTASPSSAAASTSTTTMATASNSSTNVEVSNPSGSNTVSTTISSNNSSSVTTTTITASGTVVATGTITTATASITTTTSTTSPAHSTSSSNHQFITPAIPPAPTTPQHSNPVEDYMALVKQWKYCSRLCKAMCEESLLDRHEFLQWALELLDRMKAKTSDDGFLKLFLPFVLQCLPFIVESERLSRVLAYLVCKKIGFMLQYISEEDSMSSSNKKSHHQPSSVVANCDSNAANRLDPTLKIKAEPEIRAPLATRSASTRFKKVTKMEPPTSPAIPSEPASPSTALLDSPEDAKSSSSFLSPRSNAAQDKKNFNVRAGFSPTSSLASKSITSPTMSPPTSSPPSAANQSTIMPMSSPS